MNKNIHTTAKTSIYIAALLILTFSTVLLLVQPKRNSDKATVTVSVSDANQNCADALADTTANESEEDYEYKENTATENVLVNKSGSNTVGKSAKQDVDVLPSAEPKPPTPTTTTEKIIPWGTERDFDVKRVEQEANHYVAQFEGVEIDSSLTSQNSCWTLYVSSYGYSSEQALLNRIKETAQFQYQKCVEGGNLEYDVPLRMHVKAEPSYNEKLQETYYEFYILYFL